VRFGLPDVDSPLSDVDAVAIAPAASSEFVFSGTAGFALMPDGEGAAVEAAGRAIGELVAAARSGAPAYPCDVRFGRDVVAILAAANTARQTGLIQLLPGS
jgi:hypothetical protein